MSCIWRSLRTGTAFARHCDVIGLQTQPSKDADPELSHSDRLKYRERQFLVITSQHSFPKPADSMMIHIKLSPN